ncbi:penicillin-binding protein 2 [Candidatus Endobugula sertula]|uniref:Peptidoglycan D,D-transpeptidase MrdA n=1 Tax=Candidatus Endobugula sertula TaxID=62101 RepID=A0A1D2QQA4_9GAMM|nr:penicillin-binding protein 2 [Candidatus Endobugula sertula]
MREREHLKDHHREASIFTGRVIVTLFIVLVMLGVLLTRYYSLQVIHYQNYATESDKNRILVQTIIPNRGLIYDTNGELLADNRPSFTLFLIPERVNDVSSTLSLLKTIISINDQTLQEFYDLLNDERPPYQAIPLRHRLTEEEIARLAVNKYRLSGVSVDAQLVRSYPKPYLFAHTVGYVGKINKKEKARFSEEERKRYKYMLTIGKIGLEKYYESQLFGEMGYQNVEKNALGRVLRTLERVPPVSGKDLRLYMDSRLQKVAWEAMGNRRGAVVAIDVKTGGVLAMLSTPTFNTNLFVTGISHKDYSALTNSLDLPLFDRTIQGRYPPASTVKPALGIAGLASRSITPTYRIFDPGYYKLENDDRLYRDWNPRGHGWVNVHKAIIESSDTFFYDMAYRTGVDQLYHYGSQFGLGKYTHIDIPNELSGLWPSREWKRSARQLPWFPGDTLNIGIGQGDALATPLQLAVMVSTIANRGVRHKPRLVKEIGGEPAQSEVVSAMENVSDKYWDVVHNAMYGVVHASNGTGRRIGRGINYKMAGKTGTAQVVGIKQGEKYDSEALSERHRDHALFIGFAPFDAPQIAIAVIVENGEAGSSAAAPVARKLFDAYISDEYPEQVQSELASRRKP